MSDLPREFIQAYSDALRTQLTTQTEAGLARAYELGRWALYDGMSMLDLALVHHQVLGELATALDDDHKATWLIRAAAFLAETLSSFEMALLGVRETNQKLIALNAELKTANEAALAANERLQAETLERLRVEGALWQAQKHQAVGRLAGGVAHHFNNLLTVILGNLDMVRRAIAVADPASERKLGRAAEAGQRAARLTRQLLTFSGRQMLQPDQLEPSQRLPDIMGLVGGSLRDNITVETDIPAGLWPVKVDQNELELALLNLAVNAGDAMRDEAGILRFTAANRSMHDEGLGLEGDYLMIEVADNGPGIPPEILPRIFDPFFTTKDVGVGTGLGLSQVHGFAHQSKGAVDIESAPGQGAIFRIFLPVAQESGVDRAPVASAPARPDVILVVEDDLDVAELAASILDSHGFAVKLAYRAQTALDLLRSGEPIDLVFSDVVMPGGMDGLELAQEVGRAFPDLPILLATGYSDALSGAKQLGVPIIGKPYRSNDLYSRIMALLRRGDHLVSEIGGVGV